ncbi:MAG: flagellar basal body L-ring protein FlgH [Syntrophaceae bacterium]|nr:flagellar basal body L-ring protein FlgH [Syntrophaceae bacterium]
MRQLFIVIALIFLALLSGCGAAYNATRPHQVVPVARVEPVPVAPPQYSPGSLWPGESSRNSLFTDNKARYVNDIVTIIVDESSSGQNSASTNTRRDSETNAGIRALLGLETSLPKASGNLGISVGGGSSNSMKGTGDTSRGGQLRARVAARVIRVMDNGLLLIEGRRQLTLNEEDQYIILTGLIRPDDITANNTISSSSIADAQIVYTGNGILNDKQRPGWLTRAVDWGWPF